MRPLHSLSCLALFVWPVLAGAQTPDLARILERLDRLERENRELSETVEKLRARVEGDAAAPGQARVEVPIEQRVELAERRIDDLSQTKVESAQKSLVRLTGMALFNAFTNSHQSGGLDYPVTAAATGPGHAGATFRQT